MDRLAEQRLLILEERKLDEERRARERRDKEEREEREARARAAAEAEAKEKAAREAEEQKRKEEEAAKNVKKKPLKFRDAVGRKFSFPFELCNTWEKMELLIKQAFKHVEIIGLHVEEGHYDLCGPNGEIILPSIWDAVIEP
ncbi:hypothetical protein DFH27DRAFT_474771, partial [Peziza echinospora]